MTRFDLDMDGSMEPSEHGRWVRYEDVQRKPLTDEEIESINVRLAGSRDLARLFARAIEAAHGIKGDA